MIDIHSHILPGIDDGAQDVYDTLEMALMAVNSGVKAIVATPHCNIPWSDGNYLGSSYREALMKARNAIAQERMPIKILSGMEVFVTFDLPDLIREGRILTLNHSDYLLIEFDFGEDPEFVDIMVSRLQELGLKLIIAHPERYDFIKEDIQTHEAEKIVTFFPKFDDFTFIEINTFILTNKNALAGICKFEVENVKISNIIHFQ